MSSLRAMGPRELGRALMRGDRASLKLGYTASNATIAVRELHQLNDADSAVLEAYLDGFSAGMRRVPPTDRDVALRGATAVAQEEGVAAGWHEPIARTYPAVPEGRCTR